MDSQSLGPYCDQVGINEETLLEKFQAVDVKKVTNGVIYEIFRNVKGTKPGKKGKGKPRIPWKVLASAVLQKYEIQCVVTNKSETLIRNSFSAVKNERDKILKSKTSCPGELEKYLDLTYVPPPALGPAVPVSSSNVTNDIVPVISKARSRDFIGQVGEEVSQKLAKELSDVKSSCVKTEEENTKLKKELSKLRESEKKYDSGRLNQSLKRKTSSLNTWKKKYFKLKREAAQQQISKCQCPVKEIKEKKIVKVVKPKPCFKCPNLQIQLNNISQTRQQLDRTITLLEDQICMLKEELKEYQSGIIYTKQDGKTYSTSTREIVYHLASKNVAVENMESVANFTLEKYCGKKLSDFPSPPSCAQIIREMNIVSRMHVEEEIAESKNTTVKFDGTTKAKEHWIASQIATDNATFTVSVQKSVDGTANSYADNILSSIDSLGNAACALGKADTSNQILANISNSMTDRCSVNKVAVDKVSEKRKATNPDSSAIRNFFCGLHPLDTFTKAADKAISKFDEKDNITCDSFANRNQSCANALIFAVSKMFHKDGSGVPCEIKSYLEGIGITRQLIFYHVGERFHILFHNAASLYFLWDTLIVFIRQVWGPANRLLQAIVKDLGSKHTKACCRALGLFGKLFTAPWLRLTMKDIPVLELNSFYAEAQEKLQRWKDDPTELLRGTACLLNTLPQNDRIFDSLIEPNESDALTADILKEISSSVLKVLDRQCVDQLPDGQYGKPDEKIQAESKSCTSSNVSVERTFGKLGFSIAAAPSGNMEYHAAKIMYSENKTGPWLGQKDITDKENIMSTARKLSRKRKAEMINFEQSMKKKKVEKLKEKEAVLSKQEERRRETKESMLEDLYKYGGLWQSVSDISSGLQSMKRQQDKMAAVKAQIKVRKVILEQKCDSSLFSFSVKQKAHSFKKLCENLTTLVTMNTTANESPSNLAAAVMAPEVLVGKAVEHAWNEENTVGVTWFKGMVTKIADYKTNEYEIVYDSSETIYMQFDEVFTDVKNGDMVVEW